MPARAGMHLQWTSGPELCECSSSCQEMQQPPTCQVATTLPQITSRPGCSRLMCCGEGKLFNDGER